MEKQERPKLEMHVGGQAILRGVMMRSPNSFAIAVRRANGEIALKEDAWEGLFRRLPFLKLPFLRGGAVLMESMHNGMKALRWSAEQAMEDEELAEREANGGAAPEGKAEKGGSPAVAGTMVLSLLMGFGLFIGLPHLLSWGLGEVAGIEGMDGRSPLFHAVAGFFKLTLFLGYLTLISRMPDIQEVFQYHGAEHKSIYCYENGEALTLENARRYTTLHPRCGTSFLIIVIFTAIVLFSVVFSAMPELTSIGWLNQLIYILMKLPLLVPIAGLAYEFQRLSARFPDSWLIRPMIWPGLMLQKITTKEPTDAQLEVALASLRKVLWREAVGADAQASTAPEGVEFVSDYMAINPDPARVAQGS